MIKAAAKVDSIGRKASNAKLSYFSIKRTEPFLITFFRAIFAFKRVCKAIRKKINTRYIKRAAHGTKRSALNFEISNSNKAIYEAMYGKDVIKYIPSTSNCEKIQPIVSMFQELALQQDTSSKKLVSKRNIFRAVEKHLDGYHLKERTGKGPTALVERIKNNLVITSEPFLLSPKILGKKGSSVVAIRESKNMELDIQEENNPLNLLNPESILKVVEDIIEYSAGTNIYFGSTVALQARHGGFLSYNSDDIKASAYKPSLFTHFVLKNSEDLTDNGIVKFGDALWLQAGHFDVLGAQYGSLVDQKRAITPALVSYKRASMLKAQQYGRWIILNRVEPMKTIGRPVSHADKIMLEQEWFFLASASPYESSMYKTLNNSDEAMSTKVNLFNPGEECSWKIHLLKMGASFDKAGENKRQLIQQVAMERIEASEISRTFKTPALLSSLQAGLPFHLTDDAIITNQLYRKRVVSEDQYQLHNMYLNLSKNNFQSRANPVKMLSNIYGADSNIVNHKKHIMKRQEQQNQLDSFTTKEQIFDYFEQIQHTTEVTTTKNPIDRSHNEYWDQAGMLLVPTSAWNSLNTSMAHYLAKSKEKKVSAALIIQKCVRRYITKTFNYERAMKKIDENCRMRLWMKEETRRKVLLQQALISDHPNQRLAINKSKNLSSSTYSARLEKSSTIRSLLQVEPDIMNEQHQNDSSIFQYTESNNNDTANVVPKAIISRNKTLPNLDIEQEYITSLYNCDLVNQKSMNNENHNMKIKRRPHTANEVLGKSRNHSDNTTTHELYARIRKKEKHRQQISRSKKQLDTSNGRETYGLPNDVFEDTHTELNIKTGLKFLRAMSANPNIYDDVEARKRSFQNIRNSHEFVRNRK